MLTFRQIEVFTAVMRSGSVMAAARDLRISQPTVSRIILRIQDQLGLRLFDRVKGRLVPTPEARRFLAEVERAFAHMRVAIDRAAHDAQPGRTPVRLGSSPSIGRGLAPAVMARLAAGFPHLAFQFDVLSVEQILPYLAERVGDVALTLHPVIHHDIASTHVGEGRPVAVVPRGSLFDGLNDLSDLARAATEPTWLVFRPLSVHGEAMAALFQQAGIRPARTHMVRFAESAIAMAEAGLGATIVDEFSAAGALRDKVRILPVATSLRFPVYLHRALAGGVGPVVDALEAALRTELAERAGFMP